MNTLLNLFKPDVKECFGNIPARTIKKMPEVKVENKYAANVFTVPPSWQGNLPPRFSNTGYGAYILYNIPEQQNLAVPQHPLTWSQDLPLTFDGNVKEGYAQEARAQGMMSAIEQSQAAARASQLVQNSQNGLVATGAEVLPEGTQIYNYDRLVYAQKRSRLHGLGDPIRGDLPIVPIQGDWFRPSVAANIDLRQGAVTTISGQDNSTAKELRALQAMASGKTALAQKDISFDGRQADIYVTAFP